MRNPENLSNWLSLLVTGVGALAGLLLVIKERRQARQAQQGAEAGDASLSPALRAHGDDPRAALQLAYADLDERYHQCVAQLREIQEQRASLAAAAYAAQKASYEDLALQIQKERDDVAAQLARLPAQKQPTPPRENRLWFKLQGAAWGVVISCCCFALLSLLRNQAQVVAPQTPPVASQPDASQDAQTDAAWRSLEQDPNDIGALAHLSFVLLRSQELANAKILVDRLLMLEPAHPEGRVYQAVLLAADGQGSAANAQLDSIVAQYPELARAWFFRGMLALQQSDTPRAIESFEHFVQVAPEGPQKKRISGMLSGLKSARP